MPEETAATVVDGWLHTGDLVTVNADDTYTFVARKKEVLRRRGQNLSPAEVEEAIAAHPDVLEVAVVAVPSELTEDEVKAFVVAAPGADLDFVELREWAASAALGLQGAAVLAGCRRAPADGDVAGGQAPAADRTPARRVRRRAPRQRRQLRRSRDNSEGRAMTGYPTSIGTADATSIHGARARTWPTT